MRYKIFLVLIFCNLLLSAQSPLDAELMKKGELCTALIYGSDKWSTYWETTLERTNGNVGTLKKQSYNTMLAYGIIDKLNLIVSLSYINASTSQGTVQGNKGLQDGSIAIKFKPFAKDMGSFKFNVFTIIGGSTPLSKYNADAGPTSLGLGCSESYGRLMFEAIHKSGIYFRPQTSYHLRGSAQLDRNYYYTDKGYYSDIIDVQNMQMSSLILGARLFENSLRVEGAYNVFHTIGGSDIRRQEAPLANVNMDGTSYNVFAQYYPHFFNKMSIILNYGNVLSGRNIGKSTFVNAGITYQFSLIKSQN
jgi:hypothetical protein